MKSSENERKKPTILILNIIVGFFFCLMILWYFSFRLLKIVFSITLAGNSDAMFCWTVITSFYLSLVVCLVLIKPTLKKEKKILGQHFSITAKDPNIVNTEFKKEFTVGSVLVQLFFSVFFTFVFSLPFSIIALIQIFSNSRDMATVLSDYWLFYVFCLVFAVFFIFVGIPSFRKWHWTKHQFK